MKTLRKITTFLLTFLIASGVLTSNIEALSPTWNKEEYTDWYTEPLNWPFEISKKQYRYKQIIGNDVTTTPINETSKKMWIAYIDNEYIVYENGQFTGTNNNPAVSTNQVRTVTSNTSKKFTVQNVFKDNKWGFRYGYGTNSGCSGGGPSGSSIGGYCSFHCYVSACSGHNWYSYSNTAYVSKDDIKVSIPEGWYVLDYRLVGFGETSEDSGGGTLGYRVGIKEVGELHEWNEGGGGACKNKGKGSSSDPNNWCYEAYYGNKTNVAGSLATSSIPLIGGGSVPVEGINGSVTIQMYNRKFFGDNSYKNSFQMKYFSAIERIYIAKDTYDSSCLGETYVTPKYGDWSAWQDEDPGDLYDFVEERTIYAHPLITYVEKPTLTNIEFDYDGQVHGPTINNYDATTQNKSGQETATKAGTYTISFSLKNPGAFAWMDGTFNALNYQWKINKINAKIIVAPESKILTYSGTPQELVVPGSVEGGIMQYSFDHTKWQSEIPLGTNVGEYKIYYKVVGDENHVGFDTNQYVISKILPWELEKPKIDDPHKVYNAKEQYSGLACPAGSVLSGTGKATNVGTYGQTCTLSSLNYIWKDGSQDPLKLSWDISALELRDVTIKPMADHVWEGSYANYLPEITATIEGGKTINLVNGVDFTYKWINVEPVSTNNYEAVQIANITAIGNVKGSLIATYKETRGNYPVSVYLKYKGSTSKIFDYKKYYNENLTLGSALDYLDEGYGFSGYALGEDSRTVVYRPGDSYVTNSSADLYVVWNYGYAYYENKYFLESATLGVEDMAEVLEADNYETELTAPSGNIYGARYLDDWTSFTYSEKEKICRVR